MKLFKLNKRLLESCNPNMPGSFSGVATAGAGGTIAPPGSILVLKKYTFSYVAINAKHEFHETFIPLHFYLIKNDSKQCCDTTTPESIHTKDESKREIAFAFIFGVK